VEQDSVPSGLPLKEPLGNGGGTPPAHVPDHVEHATHRRPRQQPSFRSVAFAAIASAVLGSAALGVGEHIVGRIFFKLETRGEPWPWDIAVAAAGRNIATHLLFWVPIMVACGVPYWLIARRRTEAAPVPFFLSFLALLASFVVLPADLELAKCRREVFLLPGLAAGLVLSAVIYFLARGLVHRLGERRFQRWLWSATGAAATVVLVAVLCFIRSPLFNPGAYRVPRVSSGTPTHKRTNVLWIVLDTARADRLGVYGHEAATTPFLDEWAQHCVVFDRAIANGIWTLPSHASMFTGLPACSHGCGFNTDWLDDSFQTVAEVLRENGYATACLSSNPFVGPQTNLSKGFDTPLVIYDFQRAIRFSLALLCEKWGLTPPIPWLDLDYGAALTNHLVARWLAEHADTPVFVFINYMEAHLPYLTPKRYRQLFLPSNGVHRSYELRRSVYGKLEDWLGFDANIDGYEVMPPFDRQVIKRQYEAALRYLDDRMREVIDIFRQRGLLDDTLVVIAADHGEYLDTHGLWSHHFLTYQDVIHVPLLLRAPDHTKPQRIKTCVELSDLYPTVLRAALGATAAETGPDSRDLLKVAVNGGEERIAISEYFGPQPSIKPRLLAKRDPRLRHRAAAQIAAVDSRFKFIRSGDGTRELYDLLNDPRELDNLEYKHWKEADQLDRHIERWLKVTPQYQPKPAPAEAKPDRDIERLLKALGYVSDD
jgi:arylsulfatase A-like enzyme